MTAGLPRRAILCALGSSGDVHPFVGLGLELARRGCDVTVVAAGYFRGLIEGAGLGFIDPLPETDFRETVRDPAIWHPLRGPGRLVQVAVKPLLEPLHRLLVERATDGETVVAASSLAFGARVAQETHGIPLVSVHLSPVLFPSVVAPPRLPGLLLHRGPRWFRRLQWRGIDAIAGRQVGPWLDAYRGRFGLAPARRVATEWMHSPLAVLGMFPEWFAPPQPDWPPRTRLVGFPLYSEEGVSPMDPRVAEFLAAGPPPVAFTPGSAHRFGHGFFREAAAACGRLGIRGLLLTRFPEQIPANLPAGVMHAAFVPFRRLLPRCALLVHHGGIGSTSQPLLAGIPQIAMPMGFDQFDNAARVERLGVGAMLRPRTFTAARLAPLLARLLADAGMHARCRDVSQRLVGTSGPATAADAVHDAWLAWRTGGAPAGTSGIGRGESARGQ